MLADPDQIQLDYHSRVQSMVDWISRGNTVIQLARSSTEMLEFLKVKPTTQPAQSEFKTLRDFENTGGDPGDTPASVTLANSTQPDGPQLMLWSPMRFTDQPEIAWKPLARLTTGKHQVVAGEVAIGKGKLIIVGAPTPALNGTIQEAGNLDFLLGVIGNNPVILDEWSHGIGHERTVVSFLHDVGLLPLLFQVALVAGLYVWSTSGYGKPIDAAVKRHRSSVEQIESLWISLQPIAGILRHIRACEPGSAAAIGRRIAMQARRSCSALAGFETAAANQGRADVCPAGCHQGRAGHSLFEVRLQFIV